MLKIDSHQHFWKYDPVRDAWITDDMAVIQRDFFPEDLAPVLKSNGIDGCVAVQADQSEEETAFLLSFADQYDFIKGVVGWIDLQSENVEDRLKYYSQFPKLKGFRHIIQAEPDIDFMLRDQFKRGIAGLNKYNFTYDILIYPQHLPNALKLVEAFPDQPFVIDHLAKPLIKDKKVAPWDAGMKALAEHKNVLCKISGMVTEADWKNWKKEDFKSYLDVVFNAFGAERVMFGSDWPVCKLAAEYEKVCGILNDYLSTFPQHEKDLFWGGNAINFYKL